MVKSCWGLRSDCICLFLRQQKDELEQRMSALQESRRELMVQLEGLMKLLKVRHWESEMQCIISTVWGSLF